MISRKTIEGIASAFRIRALGKQLGVIVAAWTLAGGGDARGAAPTRVTGVDPASAAANQAETAYNVGVYADHRIETVVCNDETGEQPTYQTYTPTTRTRRPGFSGISWSWRSRTAASPNPAWTTVKLRPPTSLGFDAIWSDPAVASDPAAPGIVFFGGLGVPHAKVPASGTFDANVSGTCTPMGGACVARSTDGGMSFQFIDCFSDVRAIASNTCTGTSAVTNGHFYDGASMAVARPPATGGTSSAYFASRDVDLSREAVWKMDDVGSNAADPFHRETTRMGNLGDLAAPENQDLAGEVGEIGNHVRLRSNGASLWKMAIGGRLLKVNIHDAAGAATSVADDATSGFDVFFAKGGVRTGPQYAFDIGLDENGQPEMRFVYIALAGPGISTWVQAGRCTMDLQCERPTGWRTASAATMSYFHPAIKFGRDLTTGKGYWKITYFGRTSDDKAAIFAADLVGPNVPLAPVQVTPAQMPCPDLRTPVLVGGTLTTSGYWGDYDDMGYDSCSNTFTRAFTDSSPACGAQSTFTSEPVHVSAVEIAAEPRQRVTLQGNVHILDQENIGSNESDDWPFSESCDVDPDHPVDNHLVSGFWSRCTGDEVVVNIRVTCTLQPGGDVQVAMHSELREGTGCDPNEELEDQKDTTQTVVYGSSTPFNVDLTHDCINCGDFSQIRITAANGVRGATCLLP